MTTKLDDQRDKEIIPWDPTILTMWSDEYALAAISLDGAETVERFVDYFLWDSTTECMVSVGLPTPADVQMWITWLKARPDANAPEIVRAIQSCEEYITI
jgi:hypothetical protein